MNKNIEREMLEYRFQQRHGPIIGIEQASDESLRKYLQPESRPIVHYNHESGNRPSGFMDWLFWPFGRDEITRNDP